MRNLIILILASLFAAPSLAATTLTSQEANFAVSVNGQEIPLLKFQQIKRDLTKLFAETEEINLESEEGKEALQLALKSNLQGMIDELLLLEEAQALSLEASSEEIEKEISESGTPHEEISPEEIKKQIKIRIIRSKISASLASRVKISTPEMEEFYRQNLALYTQPERIRIKRIILTSEATPPPPWEDLGFMQKGDLPEAIENVAFNLKTGQISEPVIYRGKIWVIKADKIIPRFETPFAEVKNRISEFLKDEKTKDLFYLWLNNLKLKAKIIYNRNLKDYAE